MVLSLKPKVSKSHWDYCKGVGAANRSVLRVRLYRGLYMPTEYRGKIVNVLVQVPGAYLPVHKGGGKKAREKSDDLNQVRSNFDILTFPGEVDDVGELRFFPWDDPVKAGKARQLSKAIPGTGRLLSNCCSAAPKAEEKNDRYYWVER